MAESWQCRFFETHQQADGGFPEAVDKNINTGELVHVDLVLARSVVATERQASAKPSRLLSRFVKLAPSSEIIFRVASMSVFVLDNNAS